MNKRENTLGYKILTNTGYKDFSGISFNGIQKVYKVTFDNGNSITATNDHELFVDWFTSKPVSKLKVGEEVLGTEGFIKVVSIEEDGETTKVIITYEEGAQTKEYRIDNGDWQTYSGEFNVGPNTKIEARVIKDVNVYDLLPSINS